MINKHIYIIIGIMFFITSCSQESPDQQNVLLYKNSVDINYGTDICSFTNDVIETVRYGGKITLADGTVHKFMSVECVAGFYLNMDERNSIASIEIVDFAHGQKFLPHDDLIYLKSSLRPSPNGLSLTAVDRSNTKMKDYIYDAYPGTYLSWEEVLELVRNQWQL